MKNFEVAKKEKSPRQMLAMLGLDLDALLQELDMPGGGRYGFLLEPPEKGEKTA